MSITFYTDMIGTFPVVSLQEKQYNGVVYDYNTSAIVVEPVPDLKVGTIIVTFKKYVKNL